MADGVTHRPRLVIFAEEADAPAYAAVASRFSQVDTRIETAIEGFIQAVRDADITCMARKFDKRWLSDATRLKWLHVGGTGVDRLLPLGDLRPDLVISNTPGLNAEMMADYVLCTLLMLTWDFPRLWRNQIAHKWERWGVERVEGKTVVLVGIGNIGQAIARRTRSLGMHVIGVRHAQRPSPGMDRVVGIAQLPSVLGEADYVVLALPLTPETRGLMGRRELEAMKSSAYLINVSRGSIVQEQTLIAALKAGNLAGAALDVFETEPLPAESELWQLPNVILTPHLSSWSKDYRIRSAEIFGLNLDRYLSGQPLAHVIDREKGY